MTSDEDIEVEEDSRSHGSGRKNHLSFNLNTISEDGQDEGSSGTSRNVMFSQDTKDTDGDDGDGGSRKGTSSSTNKGKRFSIFTGDRSRGSRASFSQESRRRLSSFSQESRKRLQSVSHTVSHGARKSLAFDIDDVGKREVLAHRRMSHLSKFSSIKKDQSEEILRRVSVVPTDINLSAPCPKTRRQSAAAVLFNAGAQKMSAKPDSHASTLDTYGGRSFLQSDLEEISSSHYFDDAISDSDDFAFFDFKNMLDIKDTPPALSAISEETDDDDIVDGSTLSTADETKKPDLYMRGKKNLQEIPRTKKKAWFLFGKCMNRKFKKKLSDKLKFQFDDQRQYFTTWLSFVQIAIMVVVALIYPLAPIGKSSRAVEKEILLSREGILHLEVLNRKVIESIWFGPSLESLILLGAKYAPCMRRDERVYTEINNERQSENNTGCCMQTQSDGCIQRESKYCITPSVEFKSKSVCGQDPKYCISSSIAPILWDKDTITNWPTCERTTKITDPSNNRHMTCEITGRPCCINTQGQCVITTQDNCNFWNGIYHPEANLCSQVDCLSATCGSAFTSNHHNHHPNQIYRLFLSLFLCAGFAHLAIILIFNFTILRDIEGYAGWLRTALIFLLSGAGGNLWSCVWIPYQVQVGESGALFGIFACVFVEGIQNWSLLEKPLHYMGKLTFMLFIMIAFGLLPYVDNFAHVFGFIYGILLGFIILPNVATTEDEDELRKHINRYIMYRIIAIVLFVGLTVAGCVMFYEYQYTQSGAIAMFNCPWGESFCEKFHQGQQLEKREIEY